jgi:Tfp pilus assembly protein PilF
MVQNRLPMRFVATAMILAISANAAFAAEEEAVFVFKQVAPRIVSLKNGEVAATGLILTADGLILTSANVATSPLPYTVVVDQPGKTGPAVYKKKVEIVGVHPKLDLALIKIDATENRLELLAADIAKTKGETGQRIYAVSNPPANSRSASKSIITGMLTTVDHEVDGQNYYQTDAAITPGHTGGPICDKSGKILGVVTFKFTDADAAGYAIPLDKLDVKEFVSLADRKSDVKVAAEYVKRAEKYSQLAVDAFKNKGEDSAERAYYNGAAAYNFRLALVEDPGNADHYYSIGMLLRSIEETDAGRAYLLRAVQLAPWGNALGDAYRELGLTYAKKKQDAEALVMWHEGVAKFPLAGKIWEDMAICHAGRGEFADAAYCARVALATPETTTRKQLLAQLEGEARAKLDKNALAELDAKCAAAKITAFLKERIEISNKARSDRKLFITAEFEAFIEKNGGLPIKGVAEKIPQTPIDPDDFSGSARKAPAGAGRSL